MWSVEIGLRAAATPENRRCRLDLFNAVKVGAKLGTKLGTKLGAKLGKAMSMRLEQNHDRHYVIGNQSAIWGLQNGR
jgi:hypothetical protein